MFSFAAEKLAIIGSCDVQASEHGEISKCRGSWAMTKNEGIKSI